ncbi:MAG TPA: hypothetical protein VHY08_03860, partial [Bacillota bacterium]|nr:hypothetical protein [Bacillota bacterium]
MKKLALLIFFIAVMATGVWSTAFGADSGSTPNPPENLVWNNETNEYYDATEWKWDPKTKHYISLKKIQQSQLSEAFVPDPQEEWVKKNQGSANPLFQALVAYYTKSLQNVSFQAYYDPDTDPAFEILTANGLKLVPEMLTEIKNNNPFAGNLMYAAQKLTRVKKLPLVDVTVTGRKNWLVGLRQKILDAPKAVRNQTVSLETVDSFGIFAAPHLLDEAATGKAWATGMLAQIKDSSGMKRDRSYWLSWFNQNRGYIKKIEDMLLTI